jgi:hypothetical protein
MENSTGKTLQSRTQETLEPVKSIIERYHFCQAKVKETLMSSSSSVIALC